MKRAISILLVLVMCLSMSICLNGCAGGTKLSLSNYKTYMSINIHDKYISKGVQVGYWGNQTRNTHLYFEVLSSGESANHNYNNVKIKIRIYGSYGLADLKSISDSPDETKSFEIFVTLEPNISGLTVGGVDSQKISGDGKAIVSCNFQYEVVSISGTVTPA